MRLIVCLMLIGMLIGCIGQIGEEDQPESNEKNVQDQQNTDNDIDQQDDNSQDNPEPSKLDTVKPSSDPTELIQPKDLNYLGAFRLPGPSEGSDWTWSGRAATYYPEGDPSGPDDGFPGSIYAIGNDIDQMVSEMSIPVPIISENIDDLNTATTLQPFSDVRQGSFPEITDFGYPALEYLPAQGAQTSGKLYLAWGLHLFEDVSVNTHSWCEIDLSDPRTPPAWRIKGYSPFLTADYLFEIPSSWASENTPGMRLATGRFREGVWSGKGPSLFAYGPWNEGNPPAAGSEVSAVPLLLYGVQEPGALEVTTYDYTGMEGYCSADQWAGGAWLTKEDRSAVIFIGTKALGDCWYGFSDGTVWPYEGPYPEIPEWPHDQRGYWSDDIEAQIIFYDPAELAAVAKGEIKSWDPQPYAVMSIDQYLYTPGYNYQGSDTKEENVRAVAFDRENGLLYVFEFRADDEGNSIIHVWKIG